MPFPTNSSTFNHPDHIRSYEVPHCEAFSTPCFHRFQVQINIQLRILFQIPLDFILPLMQEIMFHSYITKLVILLFYIEF
jgi:hypothetical protein